MPISGPIKTIGYTTEQLDKIGNTIIYLSSNIRPLYKTKLLKLLYFLDELSVKRYAIPLLGLEYKVWQAGPVNSDIFQELDEKPILLEKYILLEFDDLGTKINPKQAFNDDEFSDNDIAVLDEIIKNYRFTSAQDLVTLSHEESSLWYKIADENGLLELFNAKKANTSDCRIDLSELIIDDPKKQQLYKDHQQYLLANKSLKG